MYVCVTFASRPFLKVTLMGPDVTTGLLMALYSSLLLSCVENEEFDICV